MSVKKDVKRNIKLNDSNVCNVIFRLLRVTAFKY